jgi:hypothetical protein
MVFLKGQALAVAAERAAAWAVGLKAGSAATSTKQS